MFERFYLHKAFFQRFLIVVRISSVCRWQTDCWSVMVFLYFNHILLSFIRSLVLYFSLLLNLWFWSSNSTEVVTIVSDPLHKTKLQLGKLKKSLSCSLSLSLHTHYNPLSSKGQPDICTYLPRVILDMYCTCLFNSSLSSCPRSSRTQSGRLSFTLNRRLCPRTFTLEQYTRTCTHTYIYIYAHASTYTRALCTRTQKYNAIPTRIANHHSSQYLFKECLLR